MITHLRNFFADWIQSLNQYTIAYIIVVYITILSLLLISEALIDTGYLMGLLSASFFTLPLVIAGPLTQYIWGKNITYKRMMQIFGFVLGIIFYFVTYSIFVDAYNTKNADDIFMILSYVIARSTLGCSIVISTYKKPKLTRGWLYTLLSYCCTAMISALVLRAGISASLGSIEYLFDLNVDANRYAYIGVCCSCLIGSSIVLTRLSQTTPHDQQKNNTLRFFGLYVIFPLAIIYGLILTTYGAKILITQVWPKGLISRMVIGYTIRGAILYFFTYPLQTKTWINRIHTGYFVSILCFLPLLIGAIRQRIAQYGITESRYLIIMIAIWILFVGIASLKSRAKSWIWIIGGFLIITISSAYTPRGSHSVSLYSQKHILKKILTEQGFYDGTSIQYKPADFAQLDKNTQQELSKASNIAAYIMNEYGEKELFNLYPEGTGFETIKSSQDNYGMEKIQFLISLGFTGDIQLPAENYGTANDSNTEDEDLSIYQNKDTNLIHANIEGYRDMFTIASQQYDIQGSGGLAVVVSGKNSELITISRANKKNIINLADYYNQIAEISNNKNTQPILYFDGGMIVISEFNGSKNKKTNQHNISYYEIMVFLK